MDILKKVRLIKLEINQGNQSAALSYCNVLINILDQKNHSLQKERFLKAQNQKTSCKICAGSGKIYNKKCFNCGGAGVFD